jgi:NAD-dependent dihydropyrimidine dehydrogenase PreA subunit
VTPEIATPRLNTEKANRAAQHARRPGEKCRAEAGAYIPVVNHDACEGKRDCVEVCPYDVFEVRQIDDRDFSRLSFFGKLKSRAHGRLTAYTPQANLCQACGLCVVACPEKAITLVSHKHWLGLGAV